MTTWQAFLLGMMTVLTPSMLVLAWFLLVYKDSEDWPWER